MSTMFTFSIFSVIFLAIGVVLYVMSDQITEIKLEYGDKCNEYLIREDKNKDGKMCDRQFLIDATIEGPIYVYYQLDNFYQNHRRYVKSRDNEQLAGKYKSVNDLSSCDPIIKVRDLWENQKTNLNKQKLSDGDPAVPCGLVAKSFFNDTFELWKEGVSGADDQKIDISDSNIAWTSDVTYKFDNVKQPPSGKAWKDVQWHDMKDQHFIVWMRTAGLPNFRKLWGRIDVPLDSGSYILKIKNNYEVSPFQGKKSFVISTTNALGGKNYFLAICYITVGTLCMLFSFVFCVAYMKKRNNNANQG